MVYLYLTTEQISGEIPSKFILLKLSLFTLEVRNSKFQSSQNVGGILTTGISFGIPSVK